MSRRTARKHAFVLVFQLAFHNELDLDEAAALYLNQLEELTETDREFIIKEFKGVAVHTAKIDPLISKYSSGWAIERINKVDLAIMRLSIYEMLYTDDIPVGVSINEAVELAKVYGLDESYGFVNGILGKVAHEERNHTEG